MLRISCRHLIITLGVLLGLAACAQAQSPAPSWEQIKRQADDVLDQIRQGRLTGDRKQQAMMTLLKENRLYLAANPADEKAWSMSANICAELKNDECVDASARAMIKLNPQMIREGLQWAVYYTNQDRLDRSLAVLDELLESNPSSLMYLNAWILTAEAHDSTLIHSRFKGLMADPTSPEQPVAFLTAMQKSDPWSAAEFGQQLLEWSPDNPEVLLTVARGLRSTNRFKDALAIIDRLPADTLDSAHVAYLRSDCFYADHHFQKAYDIMADIDLEAIEGKPGLTRRLRFMLPLRKQALDAWGDEQRLRSLQANSTVNPIVKIIIDGEPVELELFADESPNTVAAFLAATRRGEYDTLPFMRVHTGFRSIIGESRETYPYTLPVEMGEDDSRNFFSGTVSMYMPNAANPDSSTTQWCLYHFPAPHLNGKRNVFGRIISGLETARDMREGAMVDSIEIVRAPQVPIDPVVIDAAGIRRPMSEVVNGMKSVPEPGVDSTLP